MKILVNGASHETNAPDLAAALHDLGYGDSVVATAVNSEFVPAHSRASIRLTDGDRIEILAPMQGG